MPKKQPRLQDEPKLENEAQNRNDTTAKSQIRVVVVGDVGVDHTFVSQQPPKGRGPLAFPWTYYPGMNLYSIPGGAWYTGHMVQAALEGARFAREYAACVSDGQQVHFHGTAHLPSGKVDLEFVSEDSSVEMRLSVNDDDPIVVSSLRISIEIPQNRDESNLSNKGATIVADLTLDKADLKFNMENDAAPGHIVVDQIERFFRAKNFELKYANSEKCIHVRDNVSLDIASATVAIACRKRGDNTDDILTYKDSSNRIRIAAVVKSKAFGIKVWRNKQECLGLPFVTATVEVINGTLSVTNKMVDHGKLNRENDSPLDASDAGASPLDASDTESSPTLKLSVKPIPEHGTQETSRLWFFKHPGRSIRDASTSMLMHTLNELSLFPVSRETEGKAAGRVYRRARVHGVQGPNDGRPTILRDSWPSLLKSTQAKEFFPSCAEKSTLCIIDDEGLGYSDDPTYWAPFLIDPEIVERLRECLKKEMQVPEDLKARIEAVSKFTWILIKASHWIKVDSSPLLRLITQTSLRDRTTVVVSGETLRSGFIGSNRPPGIKLAKKVSWERTIEDFVRAANAGELGDLTALRHIVVRLGLEGAIYWKRPDDIGLQSGDKLGSRGVSNVTILFDERRIEGEYSRSDECGEVPGLTTVFVSGLVRGMHRRATEDLSNGKVVQFTPEMRDIRFSLQACRRFFDIGFGPSTRTIGLIEKLQLPIVQIFGDAPIAGCTNDGIHHFAEHSLRSDVDISELLESRWSILGMHLKHSGDEEPKGENSKDERQTQKRKLVDRRVHNARNALALGKLIVVRGARRALRERQFPFAEFGRLMVVERREIEGLRSIRNLFHEYVHRPDRRRPLSVAVFGPPGSGKSFGVKQLAEQVVSGGQLQPKMYTFNLAQLNSFEQLTEQLLQVRDASLENALPVVFFDEFDAEFENKPLGWLKYFLAPMQDGVFQHRGRTLGIGKAVFVFAGGIAPSHGRFTSPSFWQKKYGSLTGVDPFVAAKGPDFHSRLQGFLDVIGINPETVVRVRPESLDGSGDSSPNIEDFIDDEDFSFVVRRAIVMRQILEKMAQSEKAILDIDNQAYFDEDVLNAFLLCLRYLHGVRSLESIFDMSALHEQREYTKTALPSSSQFQMHVDPTFRHVLLRERSNLPLVLRETLELFSTTPEM